LLVLDTSAAAPFLLVDEAKHRLPAVTEAIGDGTCRAPALWTWEVANLLWKAMRSKRMLASELAIALQGVQDLGIAIDNESASQALGRTLVLANQHGLTAYDAAYLELALRLGAKLATYDKSLREAAIAENITLYPEP
jgi:predicted nucleic acid-binding protein